VSTYRGECYQADRQQEDPHDGPSLYLNTQLLLASLPHEQLSRGLYIGKLLSHWEAALSFLSRGMGCAWGRVWVIFKGQAKSEIMQKKKVEKKKENGKRNENGK
jgi:hypothetical protein